MEAKCGCLKTNAGVTLAMCEMHLAAPQMRDALEVVRNLPGFEPEEPYGRLVLAALEAAKPRL